MTFRRYYEDELAYLREVGDAFSKANPAIAGLISQQAADPDVERLLEGFAFLTGRLRQRLDEQLPELSHGLLALLWPHYLRPIPALSIVEFAAPAANAVTIVPAGAALASRPVEGAACHFRTCFDLPLLPVRVVEVGLEERAASASLVLRIAAAAGADVRLLAGRSLRLFLHGGRAPRLGAELLRILLREVSAIEARAGATRVTLPGQAIAHAAFAPEESVLPWPRNAFPGYRVLQEYLVFPERFLFVDLPPLPPDAGIAGYELSLSFRIGTRTNLPPNLSAENFRLNTVPIINLYHAEAVPFALDALRTEYRLRPMRPASRFARIYSVDQVQGSTQGRPERVIYEPFESFRHARPGRDGRFYRVRRRPSAIERASEIWLHFADAHDSAADRGVDTIAASVTCTDGALAETVGIGGIDQIAVGSPAVGSFRNITPVVPEISPPLSGDTLWRLIAGLARSLRPLDDAASLGRLIAAYDFRAAADAQAARRLELMLASLTDLEIQSMDTLIDAIPARGRRVMLTATESGFGGPEGLHLFGAVFDAFLGLYAGLNTCYQTVVCGSEGKVEYRWPVRGGRVPML